MDLSEFFHEETQQTSMEEAWDKVLQDLGQL